MILSIKLSLRSTKCRLIGLRLTKRSQNYGKVKRLLVDQWFSTGVQLSGPMGPSNIGFTCHFLINSTLGRKHSFEGRSLAMFVFAGSAPLFLT